MSLLLLFNQPAGGTPTVKMRKTLSGSGTRAGTRQPHGLKPVARPQPQQGS